MGRQDLGEAPSCEKGRFKPMTMSKIIFKLGKGKSVLVGTLNPVWYEGNVFHAQFRVASFDEPTWQAAPPEDPHNAWCYIAFSPTHTHTMESASIRIFHVCLIRSTQCYQVLVGHWLTGRPAPRSQGRTGVGNSHLFMQTANPSATWKWGGTEPSPMPCLTSKLEHSRNHTYTRTELSLQL